MIKRVDVTFYDTYAYTDIPSIHLTNEEFYGAFSLYNGINEQIYYPKVEYVSKVKDSSGEHVTHTELEVETCKLEKFGSRYREIFKNQKLNNYYCIKNVNFTLEGYSNLERFSYISLKFYPCKDHTKDGLDCLSKERLAAFFQKNQIEFKMQDNQLTPEIYSSQIEAQKKDLVGPIFIGLYQQIYCYLQIVILETDEDISGLNFAAKDRVLKIPKYDTSVIMTNPPIENILNSTEEKEICDITVQLSAKVLTQRRKYTTLIEVLGDVGGLMEILYTFLNLIASYITRILYNKSLVNNLFSFDIDNKLVLLKIKENFNNLDSKTDRFKNSSLNFHQSNVTFFSKDTLIKSDQNNNSGIYLPKIKKKKKVKKGKKKIIKNYDNEIKDGSKSNENEINVVDKKIVIDQNIGEKHNLDDKVISNNEIKKTNKNSQMLIAQIKINRCKIYFCYCCMSMCLWMDGCTKI